MQADPGRKIHVVPHRCIHEMSPVSDRHIHVRIRDDCTSILVNNFAVNAGRVIQVFVSDLKCAGRRQMTVPARADRRLHDRPIVIQEIGFLITKVDLHRILGTSRTRQKRRKRRDRQERGAQTKPEDPHTRQLLSIRRTKRKNFTLFFQHLPPLFADGKPGRDELLLIGRLLSFQGSRSE